METQTKIVSEIYCYFVTSMFSEGGQEKGSDTKDEQHSRRGKISLEEEDNA